MVWSDVFLYDKSESEKFAILLMDTQGLFDNKTPTEDSKKIFALNALLSSFLMYNLEGLVNEKELEYLRLATDFAKLVNEIQNLNSREGSLKPFQDFLFLVRDFVHVDDHSYGLEGGNEYIGELLNNRTGVEALDDVRNHIRVSFESISGFLMPEPGMKVTTGRSYDGRWSEMDEDFRLNLMNLIEAVFAPQNLKAKKILNAEVKAKDFYEFIKVFCRAFKSDQLPSLKSIFEQTVEQHLNFLTEEIFKDYKNSMKSFENQIAVKNFVEIIEKGNWNAKNLALKEFKDAKKMGDEKYEKKFEKILGDKIDEEFKSWSENLIKMHEEIMKKGSECENLAEKNRKEFESHNPEHEK